MIHVLGWKFYAFIVAVAVAATATFGFWINPVTNMAEFPLLFAKSGFVITCVTLLLGNSTLFKVVTYCTPLWFFVPKIHGNWKGHVTTNFFDKAEKIGMRIDKTIIPANGKIPITAHIRVNLFTITMVLDSDSGYLDSETKACQLRKSSENTYELAYVTENHVSNPQETDEQLFHGAGIIRFRKIKPDKLSGLQWTNRNWQKCLNTAGEIFLKRSE